MYDSHLDLRGTNFSQLGARNVRKAQTMGLPVYAETCPQYFHLTWEDLVPKIIFHLSVSDANNE